MKVILLKDVSKVGQRYDIKDVSEGHALNMLIPRGLAMAATPQAIKKIEATKAADLTQKKMHDELLLKSLDTLKHTTITLTENANEQGHLFAGITKEMLVEQILKSARLTINPESIKLEKPIKEVGEHKVTVEVLGKKAEFTVSVEKK